MAGGGGVAMKQINFGAGERGFLEAAGKRGGLVEGGLGSGRIAGGGRDRRGGEVGAGGRMRQEREGFGDFAETVAITAEAAVQLSEVEEDGAVMRLEAIGGLEFAFGAGDIAALFEGHAEAVVP